MFKAGDTQLGIIPARRSSFLIPLLQILPLYCLLLSKCKNNPLPHFINNKNNLSLQPEEAIHYTIH